MFGDTHGPLQCHPAHDFAADVVRLLRQLPDAAVGLLPVRGGIVSRAAQQIPEVVVPHAAMLQIDEGAFAKESERVKLALVVGAIADLHRRRAAVAGELGALTCR